MREAIKPFDLHTEISKGMLESFLALILFLTPIFLILPLISFDIIYVGLAYYIIYTTYILGTILILKCNNRRLTDVGISTKGLGESLFGSILFVSIIVIIAVLREGLQVKSDLTSIQITEQLIYNFIFSGIGQEILFRGLMFFSIWRWKGWKMALIISSFLFGLVHLTKGLGYVFATLIFGLTYGFIAYQSRNIIGPTVAHGLYNFLLGFLLV